MSDDSDKSFLDRWSRRKRGLAVSEEAAQPDTAVAVSENDELDDAALIEKYGLPDPDTLKPGDSIREFMQKEIPSRLKRRALRKLWISNPVLANLDELVEYGEDYTDAATVIDNMATVYQVGKGMLRDIADDKPEAEDIAEETDDVIEPETTTSEIADAECEPSAMPAQAVSAPDAEPVMAVQQDLHDFPVARRRTMTFVFREDLPVSAE